MLRKLFAASSCKIQVVSNRGLVHWNHFLKSQRSTVAFTTDTQSMQEFRDEIVKHKPRGHSKNPRMNSKLNLDELIHRAQFLTNALELGHRLVSLNEYFDTLEGFMEQAMIMKPVVALKGDPHYFFKAPNEARKLLEALQQHAIQNPQTVLRPAISFYDVVLQAYAVSRGGRQAALEAQSILHQLLQLHEKHPKRVPAPKIKTFNIVVNAWAKSHEIDAGERAEDIIKLMESWSKQHGVDRTPDIQTVASAIDAWGRSQHTLAPERSMELLNRVLRKGKSNFALNDVVFHAVMLSWVRSKRGRFAIKRIEDLLSLMIKHEIAPNSITYSILLQAWAECEDEKQAGEVAERAESILNKMIQLYREGKGAKPNIYCFTNCVVAWSRCCRKRYDAPERVERIAEVLISLYQESGEDEAFRPNIKFVNAALSAWSRASQREDSAARANMLLARLQGFAVVDLVTYNTMLDILGKRGRSVEASKLLNWLEEKSLAGRHDLTPDRTSYHCTMSAMVHDTSQRQAPEIIQNLLQHMENLSQNGRIGIRPNIKTYTFLLDALARRAQPDSIQKIQDIIADLEKRYQDGERAMKPDVFVYVMLLKACSNVSDGGQGLKVALEIMDKLENTVYGPPNFVAYTEFLNAVFNGGGSLQSVWDRCIRGGHLCGSFVTSFARLGGTPPDALDPEWSRHVPLDQRPNARGKRHKIIK